MLTLFTVPKPFEGHIGTIQRNAVQSWLRLRPRPEIILLGDDEGTAEIAGESGARYIPDIVRNEYGTPLVNDLFEKAEREATRSVLCYVNADIILINDFMRSAKRMIRHRRYFLTVGQRRDYEQKGIIGFDNPEWESELKEKVYKSGVLHPKTGIDYFIFKRGFYKEIPPFAVGRTIWDNWLIYYARLRNVPVIDATSVITAIHQNHDYTHPDGERGIWEGPEARRNLELAGGYSRAFTIGNATHILTERGLKLILSKEHLKNRLKAIFSLK